MTIAKPSTSPARTIRHAAALVVVMAAVLVFSRPAAAQFEQAPQLDAGTRETVVAEIDRLLIENHVFPDVGKECGAFIRARIEAGAYDTMTNHFDFAEALTRDLHSVQEDLHMIVSVNANVPIAVGGECCGPDADLDESRRFEAKLRHDNYGFREIKFFAGNVGYLRLTSFAPTVYAAETAAAAMNVLAGSDALIIDLRDNGGGGNDMLLFLASYFVGEPTHLDSIRWRGRDDVDQSWTLPYVPGRKLHDTPLFIIVSEYTGSAAEAFSYNMKSIGRATIVGETTAGAAHPVTFHDVEGIFRVQIPSAQVFNKVTGKDWEGVGVVPHVEASDGAALITARLEALKVIEKRADEFTSPAAIRWAMTELEAELHPIVLSESDLGPYVGDYGERHITLKDGALYYQRDGRDPFRLRPIDADFFAPVEHDHFRVRFDKNDSGEVVAMEVIMNDGFTDRSPRDP